MFSRNGRRWRRGLISLAVAYALVLQAFLAYAAVAQADAQNSASDAGGIFVLCSHSSAATPDGGLPASSDNHCPLCTLAVCGAGLVPAPAPLGLVHDGAWQRISFVSAAACVSFHKARAGLSRAPPQNA